MNTGTHTRKSDVDLKNDVLCELNYEPGVFTSDIGVLVKDAVVTLNGFTTTYWEKHNAVCAAKRVAGISAIADDIQVKLDGSTNFTDSDIAANAAQQMRLAPMVPDNTVKITVREGWLTLEGEVHNWFQKNAAENAVHFLQGVRGIYNAITIQPSEISNDIEADIRLSLQRNAILDADEVIVDVVGSKVTLRGKVRTHTEKDEAQRVAWTCPGVTSVTNDLSVNWAWLTD